MKKVLTLCAIHQPPRLLLGLKKRGFGAGRWNGFGGKVEAGESPQQAAKREVQEEIGIRPLDLKARGKMYFRLDDTDSDLEVYLFSASEFTGEPRETEEMRPQWFDEAEIPYEQMWPEDKYWYPYLFAGKNFNVYAHYKDNETLLENRVVETPYLASQ